MKTIYFTLSLLFFLGSLFGADQEVGKHIGYVIGDYFSDSDINPEDIIEGIRDYQNGKKSQLDEKKFRALYQQLALKKAKAEAEESLRLSEELLKKVKNEEGALEVIPNKLYIKHLHIEKGETLLSTQGMFHITCKTVHGNTLLNTRLKNTPVFQHLDDAIPGFSLGVKGMHEKERRILYIHPSLAYDDCGLLDPNLALIIEVELLSTQNLCEDTAPEIK